MRNKGGPNPDFLHWNNIDVHSKPINWFNSFIPTRLFEKWASYTNTRAMQENAGQQRQFYPYFKPFECSKLCKQIGVVVLYGLSPSPKISMKFRGQNNDFVNGNDFVKRHLGPNGKQRHKYFKRFFGVQDPLKPVPLNKDFPLWKLKVFLGHMNKIFPSVWNLIM